MIKGCIYQQYSGVKTFRHHLFRRKTFHVYATLNEQKTGPKTQDHLISHNVMILM